MPYAASERTQAIRRVGLWVDRRLRLGDDPFFTLMIERFPQLLTHAARLSGKVNAVTLQPTALPLTAAG